MDLENVVIIGEDNTEYLLVKKVEIDNRIFAYLVNKDDETDARTVELVDNTMRSIEPYYLNKVVLPALLTKEEE